MFFCDVVPVRLAGHGLHDQCGNGDLRLRVGGVGEARDAHQFRLPGPLLVVLMHLIPALEDALHVLLRAVQPGGAGQQVVDGHLLGDLLGEALQMRAHRVRQLHLALLRQLQDGHRVERLARRTEAERGALVDGGSPSPCRPCHSCATAPCGPGATTGPRRRTCPRRPASPRTGRRLRRAGCPAGSVVVGRGLVGVGGSGGPQRRAGHHAGGCQSAPPQQPPPVDTAYGIRVHDHSPFPMEDLTVDALCSMPSLKTRDRCGGVCDFRYIRDIRVGQITDR